MKTIKKSGWLLVCLFTLVASAFAQQSPWEQSALNLKDAFTGTIATSLILVSIVICGITFAFNTDEGKRKISGIAFGGSMAIGAARFLAWLYT